MPVHKIPRGRLHEDITAIEREHEVVVSTNTDPDDPGFVWVFTQWCSPRVETRRAS